MLTYDELIDHLNESHCVVNERIEIPNGQLYYNLNEGEDCCCTILQPAKDGVYSNPTLMRIFDDLMIAPPNGVLVDEYAVYQAFKNGRHGSELR